MSLRVAFFAGVPGEDAAAVNAAIERVVSSGWFVLGPEVEAFETEFAAACGAEAAVGVGCGTDAIALILRALDVGPGDEVITTPLSAVFTALAILAVGARPVFADVDPGTLTIDPDAVAAAVTTRTRAVVPVHLYGQAADMAALERVASRHNLAIVEDCCQAHLATATGRPVGTIGVAGAFSFYPTKNLGALGDGGAVVTRDPALARRIGRLRNGGQVSRFHHAEVGVNSRLDELQAAILRVRLPFLAAWTDRRRTLAAIYRGKLEGTQLDPLPARDPGHVYHMFVVRAASASDRDYLQQHLRENGIETLIHYPVPIPAQPALAASRPQECPRAAQACREVLSLPLYPRLPDDTVAAVVGCIAAFTKD